MVYKDQSTTTKNHHNQTPVKVLSNVCMVAHRNAQECERTCVQPGVGTYVTARQVPGHLLCLIFLFHTPHHAGFTFTFTRRPQHVGEKGRQSRASLLRACFVLFTWRALGICPSGAVGKMYRCVLRWGGYQFKDLFVWLSFSFSFFVFYLFFMCLFSSSFEG